MDKIVIFTNNTGIFRKKLNAYGTNPVMFETNIFVLRTNPAILMTDGMFLLNLQEKVILPWDK